MHKSTIQNRRRRDRTRARDEFSRFILRESNCLIELVRSERERDFHGVLHERGTFEPALITDPFRWYLVVKTAFEMLNWVLVFASRAHTLAHVPPRCASRFLSRARRDSHRRRRRRRRNTIQPLNRNIVSPQGYRVSPRRRVNPPLAAHCDLFLPLIMRDNIRE